DAAGWLDRYEWAVTRTGLWPHPGPRGVSHTRCTCTSKETTMPQTVEPTDKQLTANGLTFHYVDWGTAGRPPMLLLHGFNQTAHTWDEFCPRVCRDYHVRAFDQRGHGDTQWAPDKDYSRDTMVRDIAAMVRELVLPPFILIGMSMGGANAMTYT